MEEGGVCECVEGGGGCLPPLLNEERGEGRGAAIHRGGEEFNRGFAENQAFKVTRQKRFLAYHVRINSISHTMFL